MAHDPPAGPDPDRDAAADAWLDGLAGRAGQGAAHADGQRLRDALVGAGPHTAPPPWAEIERRARPAVVPGERAGAAVPGPGIAVPAAPTAETAANDAVWRPALGWAAAALLAAGLLLAWQPWRTAPDDAPGTVMRGIGQGPPPEAARWQVAAPASAAQGLALALRARGARVQLQPQAAGPNPDVLMTIEAPAAAVDAVNQQLAPLETALDPSGRLQLRVTAP